MLASSLRLCLMRKAASAQAISSKDSLLEVDVTAADAVTNEGKFHVHDDVRHPHWYYAFVYISGLWQLKL